MERLSRVATHAGVVQRVRPRMVTVQIESVSACASCEAHAHCGFAESKTKTLDIPSADWQTFTEGDTVSVHIDESRGLQAVWIAYLLPALVLLAVIIGLSLAGLPEWGVALSAFAVLGLYLGALILLRRKIESQFVLTVQHP